MTSDQVMTTTRTGPAAVVYTVSARDGAGIWREVWRREVPFGPAERHRAGGFAFVEAAREQARRAAELRGEGSR